MLTDTLNVSDTFVSTNQQPKRIKKRWKNKVIFGLKKNKWSHEMFCVIDTQPPWRNGLACWTSNSKVVGSSPTGGDIFSY